MSKYKDSTGRRSEAAPLKDVFEELLQHYSLNERFHERKVVSEWADIMGHTVAKRTSSLFVKEKKLYVKLNSGPVKKELMMNKTKVLALISERYGQHVIEDVVFL